MISACPPALGCHRPGSVGRRRRGAPRAGSDLRAPRVGGGVGPPARAAPWRSRSLAATSGVVTIACSPAASSASRCTPTHARSRATSARPWPQNWRRLIGRPRGEILADLEGRDGFYYVAKDLDPQVSRGGLQAAAARRRNPAHRAAGLPPRFAGRARSRFRQRRGSRAGRPRGVLRPHAPRRPERLPRASRRQESPPRPLDLRLDTPGRPGQSLVLSLDSRVQAGGRGGTGPRPVADQGKGCVRGGDGLRDTGELLAIGSLPSYDPARRRPDAPGVASQPRRRGRARARLHLQADRGRRPPWLPACSIRGRWSTARAAASRSPTSSSATTPSTDCCPCARCSPSRPTPGRFALRIGWRRANSTRRSADLGFGQPTARRAARRSAWDLPLAAALVGALAGRPRPRPGDQRDRAAARPRVRGDRQRRLAGPSDAGARDP